MSAYFIFHVPVVAYLIPSYRMKASLRVCLMSGACLLRSPPMSSSTKLPSFKSSPNILYSKSICSVQPPWSLTTIDSILSCGSILKKAGPASIEHWVMFKSILNLSLMSVAACSIIFKSFTFNLIITHIYYTAKKSIKKEGILKRSLLHPFLQPSINYSRYFLNYFSFFSLRPNRLLSVAPNAVSDSK